MTSASDVTVVESHRVDCNSVAEAGQLILDRVQELGLEHLGDGRYVSQDGSVYSFRIEGPGRRRFLAESLKGEGENDKGG